MDINQFQKAAGINGAGDTLAFSHCCIHERVWHQQA